MVALRNYLRAGRLVAHHLVAFETNISGTTEHVNIDGGGRVRSIHRYYEAAWPFVAGVAASLVPVTSGLLYLEPVPASLVELRERLVSCGAPCRDVAVEGIAVNLTKRHGLLAAAEHYVVEEASQARAAGLPSTILVGDGHSIARTARLLGPVVIHSNVRIGENATIVGPALIGAGAQVPHAQSWHMPSWVRSRWCRGTARSAIVCGSTISTTGTTNHPSPRTRIDSNGSASIRTRRAQSTPSRTRPIPGIPGGSACSMLSSFSPAWCCSGQSSSWLLS